MTTSKRIIWHGTGAVLIAFFAFVRILAGNFNLPLYMVAAEAISLALGLLLLSFFTRIDERFLNPFSKTWQNGALLLAFTIIGAFLDPTYYLFSSVTHKNAIAFVWHIRVAANLGGGVLFATLLMMVIYAFKICRFRPKVNYRLFLVVMVLINLGACLYIAGSSTVYFWDNAGFFETARDLSLKSMNGEFFQSIIKSVLFSDYNLLLSFPISLLMRVLGSSRYVFVFSIVNLYWLPAVFLLFSATQKYVKHNLIVGVLFLLITPMVPFMVFTGFVDIAPMSVGLLAVLIWMDREEDSCARGILCGALLVLCFMLRRTFFFFSAAFGLAALLSALLCERKALRGVLAMGSVAILLSLLFMQPFLLEKVIGSGYASSYSAYNLGLSHDYFLFVRYFGMIALAYAFFAALYLLTKPLFRQQALFCGLLALCCFMTFTKVQTHGQQHLLLYLPAFYGVCLLLAIKMDPKQAVSLSSDNIEKTTSYKKTLPNDVEVPTVVASEETIRTWGKVVRVKNVPKLSNFDVGLGLLACVIAVSTAVSPFVWRPQPENINDIHANAILPDFSFAPPVRKDMSELLRLQSTLDKLSYKSPQTVGVIASSLIINSDIIANVAWSVNQHRRRSKTTICYMGDVDKRDGFSWGVLDADYLVVASPVQTHLGASNQRVITYLAEEILLRQSVGRAYERIEDTFSLEDGVNVYVYKRMRPVTFDEKKELESRFLSVYPKQNKLFRIPN